jgi:hypothetical protein
VKRVVIVSGFAGRGFKVDDWCIRPQSFELVVVARLLIKHVNDHVAVVQQDPSRVVAPLAPERLAVHFRLQLPLDIVGEGSHVAVGRARCDDEHVGNDNELGNIEQSDIEALLIVNRGGRGQGGFDGFRCRANCSVPSLGKGQ